MVSQDKIYLPHRIDLRGRIYWKPPFLNPQGTEIAKSLLEVLPNTNVTESGINNF